MKTKQCHHFIVLIGLLIGCLLPATVGASVKVGSLYYNLNASDLTAEVTHAPVFGEEEDDIISFISYYSGDVIIPSSIYYENNTYTVTRIGIYAFYGCTGLTSVEIPNSVTCIDYGAFWDCAGLTSVTIPNSVTSIGEYAFYYCYALTSVTIPNGVTSIGEYAFSGCKGLTSVTIPNGVTSIERGAFSLCTGLTSVTIPNGVTSIGEDAFYYCYALTSVTIPNGVTSIGSQAFYYCKGLTTISVDAGNSIFDSRNDCNAIIETSTNELILGCKNTVIPNSVTSIGEYAFSGCKGLTSVTIPNSVTSIGSYAFSECTGLTSLMIPNSVTSIGYKAFVCCSSLTSLTIPNSVTSIGGGAFSEWYSLTSVTIPDGVTSIEPETFSMCKNLASVIIPNGVTSIGENAFSDCYALTSITFPNGVTSIGSKALYYCTGLTSVTIPNSVTSIGDDAFRGCEGLTSISCKNETPVTITKSVFFGVDESICTLYVPTGSKSAYQSAAVWSEFTNIEELTLNVDGIYYNISPSTMTASVTKKPSGYYSGDIIIQETVSLDDKTYRVTEIEELAFYDCKSLTSVTIPNGVTSIGYQAFYNCTRLTSIDIPSSVTNIGRGAFSNCTGLTSVTIPNGVTTIEPETFNMCNSLASVIIPNGVTSIGSMAFCRCFDLTSVTIPNGVTSIGYEAFLYCTGLTSVTIPNSVTSISNEAFSNCTSLTSFTCQNETPVTITNSVFSGVNKSTCTLNVPTGSKSAYRSAAVWSEFTNIVEFTPVVVTGPCGDNVSWSFDTNTGELTISGTGPMWDYEWTHPLMDDEYNGSITSVTVEEGVTSIGDYAFYENPNLTSITIPNSVTRIGSGTFCECTGLTSFAIPNSVTNIDNDAFLGTTWYNNQPDGLVYINNVAYKYKGTMPEGTSIAIRNGTVSISECAFSSCTGLTSVTIPNSVTIISRYAFSDCTNLTSITCESQTPVSISSNDVFHNVDKSACTLYVPAGSMTAYQSAAVWSEFTNIVEFIPVVATAQCGDNLTYTIYDDMSMVISGTGPMWDYSYDTQINSDYMGSIKSVTIEEGCTTIGSYAFSCFSGLTSVDIPSSVTSIGDFAFFDCEGLTSVDIPNSVTSIGEYAFYFCTGLTSITIPNSVTSIDMCAFQGCTGLTTVTIPSSVSSIDATSFSDLTSIYVDESNATYDSRENCNAIIETSTNTLIAGCKNTVIPNSVTSIGGNAFAGCTGLTSIDIPNSVTYIGGAAFQYCTGLTSVDIPSSVTYIGYTAFSGCTSLSSISVGMTTPISIFNDAFYDVNKSTCTLYVPAGSKTAYENALYWSEFENIVEIGEGPDTDISEYDNIVYIEGAEAVVGQRVRLSLKMNNTIAPTGFQCDIYLPDGVTAAQDEDGFYLMDISTERTTARKTDYSASVMQPDGGLRFMCSSTNSFTFSGNEGEVAYLMVDIDSNIEEGTYPLILKNIEISDANSNAYRVSYVKTTLTVSTYTLGDANNDGSIGVSDFTAIANYIMGTPPASFVEKAADVNVDGVISVSDLTGEANIILYGTVTPNASQAKARDEATAKYASIGAKDVTAAMDKEFTVAVSINGNYAYSGYQFDVALPEGMTVKDVYGQRKATDVFMSGMIDDNTLRVLCASTMGETTESSVVYLTLEAESAGTYSMDIDNAIISANSSTYTMSNSSFLIAIDKDATGISDLSDEASRNAVVYDLTGRKLMSNGNKSSLQKGIYIINGHKITK